MGAAYTLHTWRINDLNFPVSINLLLVLLSFFSLPLSSSFTLVGCLPYRLPRPLTDPPPLYERIRELYFLCREVLHMI